MTNDERVAEVAKGHARGWQFSPLHGKRPTLRKWQKMPRMGQEATVKWARQGNIGLRTGSVSKVAVIDCDVGADIEALRLPATPTVETGGGGRHFYFAVPAGVTIPTSVGQVAPHIDVRGERGQAVFVGSVHPDTGRPYHWADGLSPDDLPLAPFPLHLLSRLKKPEPVPPPTPLVQDASEYGATVLDRECEALRNAPEGARNDTLNRAAFAVGTLLPTGAIVPQRAAQALLEAAQAAGLPEAEARATIESGLTAGAEKPRELRGTESGEVAVQTGSTGGTGHSSLTSLISHSLSVGTPSGQWPEALAHDALYGLAGDIIRTIEPHTEADPAALLFNFLTAFGNLAGAKSYFRAEADHHPARLFVALVGETSKGRKGTSWGYIRKLLDLVEPKRPKEQTGLSSGEGLIWAARDGNQGHRPDSKPGFVTVQIPDGSDAGVQDKRLLVVEPELASVLNVIGRRTNTLSAIIRAAWDTGDLQTLTKNTPAKATGAHVSIIGHITREELVRYLDATETANGFANRFLWVCVRRNRLLPDGGNLQDSDIETVIPRLRDALQFAGEERELRRDDGASVLWHEVYAELSEGLPGMLGAVTGRAEAQVMRLAAIFALLDCSEVIRVEHLKAALACWRYCFDSARYIFGDALGDPITDKVLRLVRQSSEGVTRTELSSYFNRHQDGRRLSGVVARLAQLGLVQVVSESTGGRPVERILPNGA